MNFLIDSESLKGGNGTEGRVCISQGTGIEGSGEGLKQFQYSLGI